MEDQPGEIIAVINSRADEDMDNRGKYMRGDGASDCPKPPKVEVGRASEISKISLLSNRLLQFSPGVNVVRR